MEKLFVEPEDGRVPILELIESAEKSIQIWMFCITDQRLISALVQAKKRGVSIEIITKNPASAYHQLNQMEESLQLQLQQESISLTYASSQFPYMHAKTMIIDEKIVCIMSLNFQPSTFIGTRDYGIILQDEAIVSYLIKLFKCDLQNAASNIALTTPNPPNSLIISPFNSQSALIQLLNQTTTSVLIACEDFDGALLSTLKQLVYNECCVRVIIGIDNLSYRSFRNQAIRSGIKMRLLTAPGNTNTFGNLFNHGKACVVDGAYSFLGSQNMTLESLTENREIGYQTKNPDIAIQLLTILEATWSMATPLTIEPNSPSASKQPST